MTERTFHHQLLAGIGLQAGFIHKIADNARGVVKPCDILACVRGRCVAIEAKATKFSRGGHVYIRPTDRIVRLADLRPHQIETLQKVTGDGGVGVVCALLGNELIPHIRQAWAWDIQTFLTREEWRVEDMQEDPEMWKMLWSTGKGWLLPRAVMRMIE